MKRAWCRCWELVVTGGLVLVFLCWPQIDLDVAASFYRPGLGFPMQHVWWIRVIYELVARLWILVFVWLLLLGLAYVPRLKAYWAPRRKAVAYLLVVLLIGPGLIANSALKNQWGRARPVHLVEFGGKAQFTPPLVPTNQCPRNCSFVSGHAAASFYPIAGFWLTRRRRWLFAGYALGLFVGFTRMAMGAHFLSDILFAGVLVYCTCWGLARVFRLPAAAVPEARQGSAMTERRGVRRMPQLEGRQELPQIDGDGDAGCGQGQPQGNRVEPHH
jgi:lipid A 4'-phosphatase